MGRIPPREDSVRRVRMEMGSGKVGKQVGKRVCTVEGGECRVLDVECCMSLSDVLMSDFKSYGL